MAFFFQQEFVYTLLTIVIAGVLWLLLFRRTSTTNGRKSLPGPWGVPIIGHIPFLGRKMNKTITALAKHYGDVFQLSIGTRKIVVVSGQRAIREALLKKGTDFAGRPDFYSYKITPNFGFQDYSSAYRAHKQLTQKGFRTFSHERKMELQQVYWLIIPVFNTGSYIINPEFHPLGFPPYIPYLPSLKIKLSITIILYYRMI